MSYSFPIYNWTADGNGLFHSAYTAGIAPITGTVTVSGATTEGQVLTGVDSGISSVANLGTKSRQWYWADTGAPISGATGLTYTLVTNDVGHTLKMVSFGTDGWSNGWTSDSADTAVIAAAVAGSWQLPVGNYNATVIAAEVIHPRPDTETNSWAKHRYHTDDHAYRIPIGMSFGSWPYFFELITAPSGMTIGQQLTVSGDKLVAGANYGVIDWATPTAGTHSIDIKVSFQDGTTPINITWDLVVVADATANVIYVDGVSGNDTTGTGTKAAPFKTMDGWYKEDYTDVTYSGYQVCYRAATYTVSTTDVATTPVMRFNFQDKPLVHYAYPGEVVKWDFDNGRIRVGQGEVESSGGKYHLSDWYIGGIEWTGGQQGDGNSGCRMYLDVNVRGNFPYDGTGGGQRMTWFESDQTSWAYTGNANNNTAIVFGLSTVSGDNLDGFKGRSHLYISRCDISGITSTGAQGNFNGWFLGNIRYTLFENSTVSGCNFGRDVVSAKSSEYRTCRRNVDASANDHIYSPDLTGSYCQAMGGGHEVSYCKFKSTTNDATSPTLEWGHHNDPAGAYDDVTYPYHAPCYEIRNSFTKGTATAGECISEFQAPAWPYYSYGSVWHCTGDGYKFNAPENGVGDIVLFATASDPYDASMDLTDRVTHLGTKGAEVAS